jgi:hypothetical protein
MPQAVQECSEAATSGRNQKVGAGNPLCSRYHHRTCNANALCNQGWNIKRNAQQLHSSDRRQREGAGNPRSSIIASQQSSTTGTCSQHSDAALSAGSQQVGTGNPRSSEPHQCATRHNSTPASNTPLIHKQEQYGIFMRTTGIWRTQVLVGRYGSSMRSVEEEVVLL